MKLYILFILLVTAFQFTASQPALSGNNCPTQCNLASVIPQDGTAITLGPAYSTIYVNAANLVSIMGNIITVTPAQPTWTVGTVVVLYQATGATVNISDPTSREYGTILSIGNAGNWEIIKVRSCWCHTNYIF